MDGDLFCQKSKSPNSSCQYDRGTAQGKHCHSSLQHKNKVWRVTNWRRQSPWGWDRNLWPFNKTPTIIPRKQGLLELSACSLCTAEGDVIITQRSCKHTLCFNAIQTLPLERSSWSQSISIVLLKCDRTGVYLVAAVAGWLCSIYTWTLVQIYNWTRPHSRLEPLEISSLHRPHLLIHTAWSQTCNLLRMQKTSFFPYSIGALPHMRCWKWLVLSTVTLITVVNTDRNNLRASSLQPAISSKRLHIGLWAEVDCVAANPFHPVSTDSWSWIQS